MPADRDQSAASLCACCSKPIIGEPEQASDGEFVHPGCEDAYENNVYFREFIGVDE